MIKKYLVVFADLYVSKLVNSHTAQIKTLKLITLKKNCMGKGQHTFNIHHSSYKVTDIATTRLNRPRGRCSEQSLLKEVLGGRWGSTSLCS